MLHMTKKQRESAAKYLYDISKGIALLTVVGNLTKDKLDIPVIISGVIATLIIFFWAYSLERNIQNE
ncbi:MAG: hypothetical protein JETT_3397 [Candidatus Jettenia ecosi]|uniref:Uncharacterized protein n=1 Tax=Candidatus Jettenia ecosi TaxID=2494326 RepID=A0A533Q6U6_9BACT|nr:MAG: hypothetical protein JETT_3397 [Candidatus Jettenia ecosi]